MRIDRIELVNFGSHRHTVLEPGDARLVVMTGPNGVGKTTLASEALGHALYKDDRGSVNAGVRNGATDSAVSVDFTLGDLQYRAIRRRTIRGAGKSSADLQVRPLPDGAWSPVVSGDREVPAEIERLLRMDANVFRTSVSLAQRDLSRFVAARASGRKEILAAIVVDPRFAPAAERASRLARELDARTKAERDQAAAMADAIAELEPLVDVLAQRRDEALAVAADIATRTSAREHADGQLLELERRLAAAAPNAAAIRATEAEIAGLASRWRSVNDRKVASDRAIAEAQAIAADADAIARAVAELPAARAELAALERAEAQDRELSAQIRQAELRIAELERPYEQAHAAWSVEWKNARQRVAEQEEHGRAGASVCVACGQPIDRETALRQLAEARSALGAIKEAEPVRPLAIDREKAGLASLEAKRRELGMDEGIHVIGAARERLRSLERTAGRADAVAAAAATIERERAALALADRELAEIGAAGQAARQRLEALNKAQAALAGVEQERDQAMLEITRIRAEIEGLEVRGRELASAIARAEASVERLYALRGERDAMVKRLGAAEVDLGRLRKLAAAFGLKGIPARVIEGVLPELGHHANEVLEQLFGMSLELRAERASADGKSSIEALDLVVRKDDVGELELERISGGQETAVSLALAIGLSRLNARRAGTPIASLVVDEPEGLDVTRLRALGQALRRLAYAGELERVVVITHTSELSEFADLVAELREGPEGVELFIDGIRQTPDAMEPLAA